jgi:MFS family permease
MQQQYFHDSVVTCAGGNHQFDFQWFAWARVSTGDITLLYVVLGNPHGCILTPWGCFQGLGAPACARILTVWYPDKLRGTFWGFWTASNNIGGFLAPIIAGTAARLYGWRYANSHNTLCVYF